MEKLHQNGIWNSIWSVMMIETIVMPYWHGPNGMAGLTFNEKAFQSLGKNPSHIQYNGKKPP